MIATILTATMTMSITMPALANTGIVERVSEKAIVSEALKYASETEKAKINAAISYINKDVTLSLGQLVAIEESEERANLGNDFSYVIDYGKYEEKITFLNISDDVVSYTVSRDDISNTITKYSDGRFLLNNHGIEIFKVDSETQNVLMRNTATNEVVTVANISTEDTVSPRAVDINYTETC